MAVLIKAGVSVLGVQPETVFALVVAGGVFEDFGIPAMVTSCTDGKHGAKSLHYRGKALDLRLPSRYTNDVVSDEKVLEALKKALGNEFDVVLESDHIHLEHDPHEIKVTA